VRAVGDHDELSRAGATRPPRDRPHAAVRSVHVGLDDDRLARHAESHEHEHRPLGGARHADLEALQNLFVGAGRRREQEHAPRVAGAVELRGLGRAGHRVAGEHDDRIRSARRPLLDDEPPDAGQDRRAKDPRRTQREEDEDERDRERTDAAGTTHGTAGSFSPPRFPSQGEVGKRILSPSDGRDFTGVTGGTRAALPVLSMYLIVLSTIVP
jgi:hypothetical protein